MISRINQTDWTALIVRMGLSDPGAATYAKITAAYSKPDRHYHTLAHVDDCLTQLETCGLAQSRADKIALALWFHDVVYNWRSTTNEVDSAAWAREFMQGCNAPESMTSEVEGLIMATRHFVPEPLVGDQRLMVDIDLSILGRKPEIYDRYETAIREEYKWVPKVTYRRERRAVLRGFLERERIFITDPFHKRYEEPARQNLKRAIDVL
jgi:predicted metal-dependent HD superfamily phosphohydrolase